MWITGDAHPENTGADRGADNTAQYAITDTDDAWSRSTRSGSQRSTAPTTRRAGG
ncbi:MAG: hypothetical protein ACRDP6_44655 [Actinoallomurus sp.]